MPRGFTHLCAFLRLRMQQKAINPPMMARPTTIPTTIPAIAPAERPELLLLLVLWPLFPPLLVVLLPPVEVFVGLFLLVSYNCYGALTMTRMMPCGSPTIGRRPGR